MPDRMAQPADHDARLSTARRRAAWEIGDPSWADLILAAYFDPTEADEALDAEEAPRVD